MKGCHVRNIGEFAGKVRGSVSEGARFGERNGRIRAFDDREGRLLATWNSRTVLLAPGALILDVQTSS
jgi:hypothetical protein